ncbi:Stealth CR1 domain-containing protein [Alteromonas flava]|uniref:Stealth CR1 domain-containing protein n=1 Tax=Alteromonas flava TaxID=2048003 RepID=UPI000C283C48|nr:Stealth CR1 domain-containing protein [Alteromonas flava]
MSSGLHPPIDFVVTWVDGNDPDWLAQRNQYSPDNQQMNGTERFRDWDNLQYLFRAFETFTPWVNKIYFVTWGHLPSWLNTDHPKLKIVRHEDFLDAKNLPVFNINAIETNFHRISGLSEHFVYFNDDTFLLKAFTPEVFFKKGLPVNAMISNIMHEGVIAPIVLNDIELINKNFNRHKGEKLTKRGIALKHFWKWFYPGYGLRLLDTLLLMYWKTFSGFVNYHHAQPFLKSVYGEVWEKEPAVMQQVSASKFRANTDVNQYLFRYWQFASGKFSPDSVKNAFKRRKYVELRSVADVKAACEDIESGKYEMYCLNDSMSKGRFTERDVTPKEFEDCIARVQKALTRVLPHKSEFEL